MIEKASQRQNPLLLERAECFGRLLVDVCLFIGRLGKSGERFYLIFLFNFFVHWKVFSGHVFLKNEFGELSGICILSNGQGPLMRAGLISKWESNNNILCTKEET